jgi:hypothetical protein
VNISRFERPISLIPFGYLIVSRGKDPWQLLYMVGNQWLPAAWLLVALGGMSLPHAASTFVLGYIAFIASYELGYLANDTWDASRSSGGRRRVGFAVTPTYALLFVAIRIAAWALIGVYTGWIAAPAWLFGYATLIAVFTLHNLLESSTLRIATFLQLSVLRFTLPVIAGLSPANYLIAVTVALIFYTPFRLLSYLDSKNLLRMTERSTGTFKFGVTALQIPLALYLCLIDRTTVFVQVMGYYLGLYALVLFRERVHLGRRSPH